MSRKYQHLLSPLRVRNTVFKNRLSASPSAPGLVQGSQTYPTEPLIIHYGNKARNGAAIVTCRGVGMPHFASNRPGSVDQAPPADLDIYDPQCQRYLSQVTEAIHFYGGKASMQIGGYVPLKYDVSAGIPSVTVALGAVPRVGEEIPAGLFDEVAEDFVRQALMMKQTGFDMVFLHMAYRATILGRFLSPLTNKRKDEYGGSLENQARFPLMVADRIKKACGEDFLIEASLSGVEPPGGRTLEETVELSRILAGHIDLLQLRAAEIDPAHPTGYNPERMPFLYMAEALKKGGANIAIVTVGGYQDLDACEEIIASGKADLIAMARSWISNPEYGRLAYEGRNEDVVPCLRCNACHRSSNADPMVSVCAVNPVYGLEHTIERMVAPPTDQKKVAVVGGGPAGMEAALVAAGRGHHVTLYEKSDALGGMLKTVENVSFKWPQKDFKDFMVRQVGKANIEVLLNTEATAGLLKKRDFDAVVAAVGGEPIVPRIPGAEGKNIVFAQDVYGNEDSLAGNVVIIGGGEVGVETGMHLAEKGHKVTVLEMRDMLAADAPPLHFYTMFRDAWEKLANFSYVLKARCTGIGPTGVTYVDSGGAEQAIGAGSVVIAVGMKPRLDQALKLQGAGDRFFMIGDCNVAGNIQKAMRSAFATASML